MSKDNDDVPVLHEDDECCRLLEHTSRYLDVADAFASMEWNTHTPSRLAFRILNRRRKEKVLRAIYNASMLDLTFEQALERGKDLSDDEDLHAIQAEFDAEIDAMTDEEKERRIKALGWS